MFELVNGIPKFYIGKINDVGYTSLEEKKSIIEDLGDIEIEDKPIKIDRELKEKAEKLGELQLTYSKSEFIKYLSGEKEIPEVKIKQLENENRLLEKSLMELSLMIGGIL